MIRVDGLVIQETWTEYAVDIDGVLIDCEDEEEARQFAMTTGCPLLERQHFVSDWVSDSIPGNVNE